MDFQQLNIATISWVFSFKIFLFDVIFIVTLSPSPLIVTLNLYTILTTIHYRILIIYTHTHHVKLACFLTVHIFY